MVNSNMIYEGMHFHIIRYTSHIFSSSPAETLVTLPAVTGVAVVKEGGVALGKGKRELLEEVANGGGLLLSSVPLFCRPPYSTLNDEHDNDYMIN